MYIPENIRLNRLTAKRLAHRQNCVLQFYATCNDSSIEKEIPGTRGIRSGLKQRCQNPCTDLRQ